MRPGILKAYRAAMTSFVMRKFGLSREDADARVLKICKERYKPMAAIIVETLTDGNPELKAVDLVSYMDKHADDLISPSGTFYKQHEKCTGKTIGMILQKLKERKMYKKEMMHCKAIGDLVRELQCYYQQTLIKIGVNSLPGNYGSPYSIFYSKDNYNAITSAGRALISYANTCIEHVLGGNPAWFSIDQFVNHINIHLNHGIDTAEVTRMMNKHQLKWVDHKTYLEFVKKQMSIYHIYKDWTKVEEIINLLNKEELQYFYYFQNLRHIIIDNEEVFKPWFHDIFDVSKIPMTDTSVVPDDLFKLDGALVNMVNVAFADIIGSGDPKIQVYDLPKVMPDKAVKFVHIARYVEKELHKVDDLFALFIHTPLNVPDVFHRKFQMRNSSVVSDTDSVIFTVKDWAKWYTGDIYKVTNETLQVTMLMIYWITLAVAHVLKIYSISHGAKGDRVKDMAMKNEFFYPTMCLADVKKHYAGVVAVQEGVILPKPATDIKGVQFKGSDICKAATKFAEDYIVEDILKPSLNGKIDGHQLIQKVMEFERVIYNDTKDGKTNWVTPCSIKTKDGYKDPLGSNYFYYLAWQEIFSHKYGELLVPTKTVVIPIHEPTSEYFKTIAKVDPKIAKNFENFILKYGKCPTLIAINPQTNRIPEELIPLVDIRKIVYTNTKPCRLILRQLGISVCYDEDMVLFNEVYGDVNLIH